MTEYSGVNEAIRQLSICNACRYCEGYCYVWDAIEMKFIIEPGYVEHLANLCHDCRDCYYACPYNEPDHAFKLNIPKTLGNVRMETYENFIRPKILKKVLQKEGIITLLTIIIIFIASLLYISSRFGIYNFYKIPVTSVFPVYLFKGVSYFIYLYVAVLWIFEGVAYWNEINDGKHMNSMGIFKAIYDAINHKNFWGGGTGCKIPSENNKYERPVAHMMVFFGFIIALISVLFYPGIISGYAGYAYFIGSILLFAGSIGMIHIHMVDTKGLRSEKQSAIDYPFTVLLFFVGFTGILIPISVKTYIFNLNFLIHDVFILTLFILAPFSKFIHPLFRFLSLIKYRIDTGSS